MEAKIFDDARFGSDLEMYLSLYQHLLISDKSYFDEKLLKSLDIRTRIKNLNT